MLITVMSISFLYLIVFGNSSFIVEVLSGAENEQAVKILRLLSFSVIISAVNLFLGGNRLLPFGYKKYYVLNTIYTCIFYFMGFALLYFFDFIELYTVCYLYLFTEFFMLIINVHTNKKLNLLF